MSIRIPIGSRVFAPSWIFTLLTIALCVAFFYLGRWQWGRGELRQAEYDQFAAGAKRMIPLGTQGVDQVRLLEGDREVYGPMSLHPAE